MSNLLPVTGVLFKDFLPASRLQMLTLTANVPLAVQPNCPTCDLPLLVMIALVSRKDKKQIRVGLCDRCGYLGYIDRPTHQWLIDFYARDWDREFTKTPEEVEKDLALPIGGAKGSRHLALSLSQKIKTDKNRPFCDIGSGYGLIMEHIRRSGFTRVFGVENSHHRAALVRQLFELPVFEGEFGDLALQDKLKKIAPFGLLFSHHVLEHVYDPNQFIKSMAALQNLGDKLILSLPNRAGEHINYAAFYLPHLHGFTKESLERLLNKYGYEVVIDDSPDETNIIIAAERKNNPQPRFALQGNYQAIVGERLIKSFGLAKLQNKQSFELYWEQKIGSPDWVIITGVSGRWWGRVIWRCRWWLAYIKSRIFHRFTPGYTFLIEKAADNKLVSEARLEIQFNGPVTLFIK